MKLPGIPLLSKPQYEHDPMLRRVLNNSFYISVLGSIVIYICMNDIFYSIINFFGGILSVSGFKLTIKMTDKILRIDKPRGQGSFFLVAALKLAIISGGFYLVSLKSEIAVLFYILGLSMIPLAIFVEGGYQLYRSFSNGRT